MCYINYDKINVGVLNAGLDVVGLSNQGNSRENLFVVVLLSLNAL